MKGVGMLVILFRGANFRCWSHLGCSRGKAIIHSLYIAVKVSFKGFD